MLDGIGARGVGEDAHRLVGLAPLEDHRSRAVAVDHAVAVVGIGDPRHLGAHYQGAEGVSVLA